MYYRKKYSEKKYGLYEWLNNKETFYFHAYNACFGMYKRIILKYKKRYIKLLKEIFEDIKKIKILNICILTENKRNSLKIYWINQVLKFYLVYILRHLED